ncbi:MAG: TetR/AcrR family transcriptional regulator [Arenicella sp.]|nr:TetR/AcrR family transcriptional regulator [Arenicella sp.]
MRYNDSHKKETEQKITNAALLEFRSNGYHGVGIDGIAKSAGVTSGAFYTHFNSKSDAFLRAIELGLEELNNELARRQGEDTGEWLSEFLEWYLTPPDEANEISKKTLQSFPVQGGCALTTLAPEVCRSGIKAKQAFEKELVTTTSLIKNGLNGGGNREAWSILSGLLGAITLARSVEDNDTAVEILSSVLSTTRALFKQQQ